MIRTVTAFVRRKWTHVCINPLFWLNIALVLGTVAFAWRWPGPTDTRMRYWALFLQVVGAWIVWRDLTGSARDFGVNGILLRNWRWFKSLFGFKTLYPVGASFTFDHAILSAVPTVSVPIDPAAPIEERLRVLEQYIKLVDEALAVSTGLIYQREAELRKQIRSTKEDLDRAIRSTDDRLKDVAVGNYPKLLFGAWWVLIGTVLSGVAPELSKILAGRWQEILLSF